MESIHHDKKVLYEPDSDSNCRLSLNRKRVSMSD